MKANNYVNIYYTDADKKLLENTVLSKEELNELESLKINFQNKTFYSVIEDLFKFHKNDYSTSQLSDMYKVSTRQIQRIFKDLGINRNRCEAQKITVSKQLPDKLIKSNNNTLLVLPERLEEFLNYLSIIKGKSVNTVAGYKIDLTMFFRFLKLFRGLYPKNSELEEIIISDIDDTFIKRIKLFELYAFLSFVEKQRNNSSYTRARKVAAIKSFFKYIYSKTRILDENPASELETPKISKRNPVYLTLEESKNLLYSIDDNNKYQKRDLCIITLFLNCGLRLSELCSINISKIKEDTLTILGKGNKERTVYLNKACLKAISQYLNERNLMEISNEHKDALFISERKCRINKRTVERIVKKYIGAAGLDKSRYTPHKLRHTAATLMYKHGNVDIRSLQKILGHENISTTQIYTHVDDEQLRQAVQSNPLSEE